MAQDLSVAPEIFNPSNINALSDFLKWGPIGLAGLLLLLVIMVLLLKDVSPSRERILRSALYVGAVCFVIASISQYLINRDNKTDFPREYYVDMRVLPLDQGVKSPFPLPIIDVNGTRLDPTAPRKAIISSNSTAIVDVTDAFGFVRDISSKANTQRQTIIDIMNYTESLLGQLSDSSNMIAHACSGGPSGQPPQAAPQLFGINSNLTNAISKIRGLAETSINEPLPSFP